MDEELIPVLFWHETKSRIDKLGKKQGQFQYLNMFILYHPPEVIFYIKKMWGFLVFT